MQPSRGSCGGALRRARGEQLGLVRALQGCGVKFLSQSRIKKLFRSKIHMTKESQLVTSIRKRKDPRRLVLPLPCWAPGAVPARGRAQPRAATGVDFKLGP